MSENEPARGSSTALRATFVVALGRAGAMALSFVLGMLSAGYFGASVAKDCYLVAESFMALVSAVLVGGIYPTLMVRFSGLHTPEAGVANALVIRHTVRRLALLLAPLLLCLTLFPQVAIHLIAPGFDPSQIALAGSLLRITAVTMVFSVLYAIFKALFNSRGEFSSPALAYLAVGVAGIVVLVGTAGLLSIHSLAIGALVGNALALAIIIGLALSSATLSPVVLLTPAPEHASESNRRFWVDFAVMSLGSNFGQVNVVVNNLYASFLQSGSISALGFASVVVGGIEVLAIFSIAEVVFSRLASASHHPDRFSASARDALRWMGLATLPMAAGLFALRTSLVRALFERGEFDQDDTRLVVGLLGYLAPKVVLAGYLALFWRILVARRRLASVAVLSVSSIALNAGLNYTLVPGFGAHGIALSITTFVCLALLIPGVLRETGPLMRIRDWRLLASVVLAAAIMGVTVLAVDQALARILLIDSTIIRFLRVGVCVAAGGIVYLSLLHVLRIPDAHELSARLKSALRRLVPHSS